MRRADLTRAWANLPRPPATAVDIALAAVFLVAVSAKAALATCTALALAANLLLRRRIPLAAFAVGAVALVAEPVCGITSSVSPYANQIGLYALGLYATKTRAWWGPAVVVISVPLYFAAAGADSAAEPVGVLVIWLATWALGYGTARRREDQEKVRRAERLQVLAEERSRTARELHDVIGHTVNVLVVQAGAARLMLDSNPETARELLLGMERAGREALGDLDQVLGLLRDEARTEGDLPPEPHDGSPRWPGLAQVPELVRRLAGSGVAVSLNLAETLDLPKNVDLSAYRIVQEGLTNTLKHAAPCSAHVAVRRDGQAVVVEVSDDGPGVSTRRGGGRGLQGIAERVSLHGGAVEHGRGDNGGFRLRAVLPLP